MNRMKLCAGIVTTRLAETKAFYLALGFHIKFEADWYLLLEAPGHGDEISFLLPGLPDQAAVFRPAFSGQGIFVTIEVEDVDAVYRTFEQLPDLPVAVPLRDEPWGDRHFALVDPNGVALDFVTRTEPTA
ncbi:VOC family protein [Hymenobacter terrenus]|uniref:VOC family protein n=1 Tax=Hymenobacter terrenus TaxID=1629124 RepID=UPI000B3201E4|nr:VOC family protein [Hymenobacter terrenus]